MTKAPQFIEGHRSMGAVLSLLREQGISHVPVIEDGKPVGMISLHDVIEQIYQPRQRQTVGEIVGEKKPILNVPARGIMTTPLITVTRTQH